MEIPKAYDPQSAEEPIYQFWLKKNLFKSVPTQTKKSFTIVIPPPNVTGSLHMGHALNNTLQDAVIRYKKLCGFNTCWVPGTDHGGIATQNVVEKILLSEGKNKNELGREKFLEKMWEWKNESGEQILNQLKKLGCALDWDRTRFTLDALCSRAVNEAFVRLYQKGLIYRGRRLVNWCPRCMTALSDIEVEHEEEIGKLWHIKYPLKNQRTEDRGQGTEKREERREKYTGSGKSKEFKAVHPFRFTLSALRHFILSPLASRQPRATSHEPRATSHQPPSTDFVVVATTRPETMLGDTAVAVHPDDERYKHLIGEKIILPLVEREIPIIADNAVDITFGTGAVKVTPAHDPSDFEIGMRHNLEKIVVIDYDGKMLNAGKYTSQDRYHARKEILKNLQEAGLLLETVEHPHSVGVCYRCSTTIEPLISEQWFLDVKEMSGAAVLASKNRKIKFYPASWEKPYLLWLENLKDWCISRQIWWGHRIPVWYCAKQENRGQRSEVGHQLSVDSCQSPITSHQPLETCPPIVSAEKPEKCPHCGGTDLKQDEDVLDTWFSSALWPFSVFAWPENQRTEDRGQGTENRGQRTEVRGERTENRGQRREKREERREKYTGSGKSKEFKAVHPFRFPLSALRHFILSTLVSDLSYYYPTSVLVTGHEILYLWVARMVQFGIEFMGEVPFREVYIHGIVRDKFGKKMSKSLGNVVDPLDIMKKYGTDALRFAMISSASAGRDIQISEDSFVGARNFANKLYNAARFVLLNLQSVDLENIDIEGEKPDKTDRWLIYELSILLTEIKTNYENYELDKSSRAIYDFTWSKYCDWYIEFSKERLYGDDLSAKKTASKVLVNVLIALLKVLHPIMPFITETLWQSLRESLKGVAIEESIMLSSFPQKTLPSSWRQDSENVNTLIDLISKIRSVREEMRVPSSVVVNLVLKTDKKTLFERIEKDSHYIRKLARVGDITALKVNPTECAYGVVSGIEFFIPLKGLVDIKKEKQRLEQELEGLKKFRSTIQVKLKNENFVKKAPPAEVENTKNKLSDTESKMEKIAENLKYL